MGENRDSVLISGCSSDDFSNAMGKIAMRAPLWAFPANSEGFILLISSHSPLPANSEGFIPLISPCGVYFQEQKMSWYYV